MSKPTYHLKLRKAQTLIRAKQFAEAREVLTGVDHPQAHLWLAQIDKIVPVEPIEPVRKATKKPLMKWLLILILGLLILGACYATVINPIIEQSNAIIETACYEAMTC